MLVNDLLGKLNSYQLEAVKDMSPVCLVNAQVGSGKTTVLTTKTICLHEQFGVPYEKMVVLTFTNKAAEEIKTRIRGIDSSISGDALSYFGTFHSVALTLLKKNLPLETIGYNADFSVMDPDEELDMANRLIDTCGLNIKYRNKLYSRLEKLYFGLSKYGLMKYEDDISALSELLVAERKRCGKMNFHDLIEYATRLLPLVEFDPNWVIIDEFQDTNNEQMLLIDALKGRHTHLFAVGDPNQVIYTWRGSASNIFFDFAERYNAKQYSLPINYRSCTNILDVARCFIKDPSALSGIRNEGNKIRVVRHYDAFNEAQYLTAQIRDLATVGVDYRDIAIFYRTQKQSAVLERTFEKENIPYRVSARKTLKDYPVLKWLVSVLRFSINKYDIDSAIAILSDKDYGFSCSRAEAIRLAEEIPSQEGPRCTASKCGPEMFLKKCLGFKTWANSGNTFSDVVDYFDLDDMIHPNSSTFIADKASVLTLIERIRSFSAENDFGLYDGIEQFISSSALFGINILENHDNADENVVNLMTLHAAKGLEFRYVYVIGVNDGFIPLRSSKTDDEEEKRLFFVGLTRAKDSVELSYYINPDDPRVFGGPSHYIHLIPSYLLDADEMGGNEDLQGLRHQIIMSQSGDQYGELTDTYDLVPPRDYDTFVPPDDYDYDSLPTVNKKTFAREAKHPKYGIGTIIDETDEMIVVSFDGYGEKTFMKVFGEVEILD